jgi:hypothetical protein
MFRLPEGWSEPERFEDVIDVGGLPMHRAGLSSTTDGAEALGSAADWEGLPSARAEFELLERVTILDASRARGVPFRTRTLAGELSGEVPVDAVFPVSPEPASWAYARSNGAALYSDWAGACTRALHELAERDRILRAWLGQTAPVRVAMDPSAAPIARMRSYEWSAFSFPAPADHDFAPGVEVVGVFGFPCAPSEPFAVGFGARDSVTGALAAAAREALQLLSFLWGEPVSSQAPDPTSTPMCHLETYQARDRQELLRRWLEGRHRAYGRKDGSGEPTGRASVAFVDLTPAWMQGNLRVAKALSDAALPLTFGLSPLTAQLPEELRIHPIP